MAWTTTVHSWSLTCINHILLLRQPLNLWNVFVYCKLRPCGYSYITRGLNNTSQLEPKIYTSLLCFPRTQTLINLYLWYEVGYKALDLFLLYCLDVVRFIIYTCTGQCIIWWCGHSTNSGWVNKKKNSNTLCLD